MLGNTELFTGSPFHPKFSGTPLAPQLLQLGAYLANALNLISLSRALVDSIFYHFGETMKPYQCILLACSAAAFLSACQTAPRSAQEWSSTAGEVSRNPTYGYTQHNPIKIGSIPESYRYLKSLTGPKGEIIHFKHEGKCCSFVSENGPSGFGFLDIFVLSYDGLKEPVKLYINAYQHQSPKAPKDLRLRGVF